MNIFGSINNMFGKIQPGMCRISMTGKIAIKTNSGYKSYDVKTGKLTNCDNFAFEIGEDMFFVIPTNKVQRGDIILASGKPRCVIEANRNEIKVFSYEDGTIETLIPERHIFMGKQYFYGKIISIFGNMMGKSGGINNIFKYAMLSEMMKGNADGNGMASMMPMMLMMNGGNVMDGMFDMDDDADDEDDAEEAEGDA